MMSIEYSLFILFMYLTPEEETNAAVPVEWSLNTQSEHHPITQNDLSGTDGISNKLLVLAFNVLRSTVGENSVKIAMSSFSSITRGPSGLWMSFTDFEGNQ